MDRIVVTSAISVPRRFGPILAVALIGASLFVASAHAAPPATAKTSDAEQTQPTAPSEATPVTLPAGMVGFVWG